MQNYDLTAVKFCELWHFERNDVLESWSHISGCEKALSKIHLDTNRLKVAQKKRKTT